MNWKCFWTFMATSSTSPKTSSSSKYEVHWVTATKGRPSGIKYRLTLHDPRGERIYGIDNAHKARRRREFDHRHPYGSTKLVPYEYRGPAVLLEDFLREVERILTERGVL